MAKHQLTGKKGETLAVGYLQARGFVILHQNWRFGRYEVDVIASRENVLHFIEVKTRNTRTFGAPEESVDEKKIKNLMEACEEYQYLHPGWKRVQYDVLSIVLNDKKQPEYFFIEDVYL